MDSSGNMHLPTKQQQRQQTQQSSSNFQSSFFDQAPKGNGQGSDQTPPFRQNYPPGSNEPKGNGFTQPNGGGGGGGGSDPSGQIQKIQFRGDENDVYSHKAMLSLIIKTCPTTAFDNKSFVSGVIAQVGGIDKSANDILIKWIKEPLDHKFVYTSTVLDDLIEAFHHDSGGF